MTQQQWGSAALLSNQNVMMKNVPTLLTVADPIFDNILVAPPEFGSFLLA
jgi:hypothetical protein